MIEKFVKYSALCLLMLSSGLRTFAQDAQVFAKIDQASIKIGDQTKLRLTAEQSAKDKVVFPVLADTLAGKIQILSSAKADTVRQGDRLTVSKTYVITSFDAGTYPIAAFVFATEKGNIETNALTLDVQTVKVDTTKAIYDIKQPLAVSYTFMDWLKDNWQLVVFPLAGLAVLIALIYYWRKKQRSKPAPVPVVVAIPVHTIAINKLIELRDKKLWQRDEVKQYYIELSDVIREYLENRYRIKTQEKTTDEIFESLRYVDIAREPQSQLRQLLVISDLVKFAKERPLSAENEKVLEAAIDFVLQTQEQPAVPLQGTASRQAEGTLAQDKINTDGDSAIQQDLSGDERYQPKAKNEGGAGELD